MYALPAVPTSNTLGEQTFAPGVSLPRPTRQTAAARLWDGTEPGMTLRRRSRLTVAPLDAPPILLPAREPADAPDLRSRRRLRGRRRARGQHRRRGDDRGHRRWRDGPRG